VSLFYVEQQQTMSHKIEYVCQRYTKLTKNCINLLFGFLHRVQSKLNFVHLILCVMLIVGERVNLNFSLQFYPQNLYNHMPFWNPHYVYQPQDCAQF